MAAARAGGNVSNSFRVGNVDIGSMASFSNTQMNTTTAEGGKGGNSTGQNQMLKVVKVVIPQPKVAILTPKVAIPTPKVEVPALLLVLNLSLNPRPFQKVRARPG